MHTGNVRSVLDKLRPHSEGTTICNQLVNMTNIENIQKFTNTHTQIELFQTT